MSKPSYHTQCTGQALATVRATEPKSEEVAKAKFTLFGACFCPFVQRAWAVLCFLSPPAASSPWQYRECDPYAKPADLLELSPKGLVPALRLEHDPAYPSEAVRGICESTVIMEYLIERFGASPSGQTLLPPLSRPYERAQYKIAADRLNRTLIPAFYRFLQAQNADDQIEHGKDYVREIEAFVQGMDSVIVPTASEGEKKKGAFWDGSDSPSYVDFLVAPWLFRTTNVLKHFRALDINSAISEGPLRERYIAWQDAVFHHPAWTATVSDEQLYLDSYVRYAENRPNTSQVANAINQGRGLP
ncbi:hypothetical protein OC834_001111 [Tilletia horrida]|nr:hypothetical protein OC834_001111 [Tilletia horrida]KAK0561161.1 hypothetical protein OC844_003369 [Tilletia horrida]